MAPKSRQAMVLLAFASLGICYASPHFLSSREANQVVDSMDVAVDITHRALKDVQLPRSLQSLPLPSRHGPTQFFGRRLLVEDIKKHQPCHWDDEHQNCSVSEVTTLELLTKLDDDRAADAIQIKSCSMETKESGCMSENCTWEDDKCIANLLQESSLQTCLGSAAVLANVDRVSETCQIAYQSVRKCNKADDCTWNEDDGACIIDIWKTLAGVPSLNNVPAGLLENVQARKGQFKNFQKITKVKSPDDILSWELPPFDCPDDIPSVICEIVTLSDNIFKTAFYCQAKHASNVTSCDNDPLCEFEDEEEYCTYSHAIVEDFIEGTTQILIKTIENPITQRIMKQTIQCLELNMDECKEQCEWDKGDGVCAIQNEWLFKELGKVASEDKEFKCQLLAKAMQSGCFAAESNEECGTKQDCEWDTDKGCDVHPDILTKVLFDLDPAFRKDFASSMKKCSMQKSQMECEKLSS